MKQLLGVFTCAAVLAAMAPLRTNAAIVERDDEDESEEEAENVSPLFFEAGVDLLSKYMWRGMVLDRNPVYQPWFSAGVKHDDFGLLYFNYWTSLDLTHKRNSCWGGGNSRRNGSMIEQDFYIGWKKSFGPVDFEIGNYWYDYPYNGPDHCAGSLSYDGYAAVTWNTDIAAFSAETYWAYDNNHGHDPATVYWCLGVEREFETCFERLTLTPKATLGIGNTAYVQENIGNDGAHTELCDQTLSLNADYQLDYGFSIGAQINYTWLPSRTMRHGRYMTCGEENDSQVVWGGFSLNYSF